MSHGTQLILGLVAVDIAKHVTPNCHVERRATPADEPDRSVGLHFTVRVMFIRLVSRPWAFGACHHHTKK
jgi:hypothetical protein